MRVLFLSRSTLYTIKGGDTIQMEKTAEGLCNLGLEVDIKLAGEAFNSKDYDIVHFFNLIRPGDLIGHLSEIKCKLVVSPIYVDYSAYDQNERKGPTGMLTRILGKFGAEYVKGVGRFVLGQDRLQPSYLLGHRRAMKRILDRADLLLPNSASEGHRVKKELSIQVQERVIPCGIDPELFFLDEEVDRNPNLVLSVGQIEGRKNQHRLIEATRNMDVDLVIIGRPSPNNVDYYEYCQRIAHERVTFIDFIPQDELRAYFQKAAVHALSSWFETVGLTSLEAGACGCGLVVSEMGDTRDYFDGLAEFCHPGDVESIRNALIKALESSDNKKRANHIRQHYTWEIAAQETLKAYRSILN